jgi:peroxiredoxin
MSRGKWYSILIIGAILLFGSLAVSCTSRNEAPNFTLQTIDGKKVSLSEFRGKPVMLTFWSINCPGCVSQIPSLQAFYVARPNKTVELLAIDVGDNPIAVNQFVSDNNLTFPILLDPGQKVAQAYGIPGVPVTFFIDYHGLAQAYKLGPFQSQDEIEKAIDSLYPALTGATSTTKGAD